jgi:hypothetical protein
MLQLGMLIRNKSLINEKGGGAVNKLASSNNNINI